MQRTDDVTVCLALLLASLAAILSTPHTGLSMERAMLGFLSSQSLAVDMPMSSDDGQVFVSP